MKYYYCIKREIFINDQLIKSNYLYSLKYGSFETAKEAAEAIRAAAQYIPHDGTEKNVLFDNYKQPEFNALKYNNNGSGNFNLLSIEYRRIFFRLIQTNDSYFVVFDEDFDSAAPFSRGFVVDLAKSRYSQEEAVKWIEYYLHKDSDDIIIDPAIYTK